MNATSLGFHALPPLARETIQGPDGPVSVLRMPDVRQDVNYTCGPSSLQAVLGYYGEEHFEKDLADLCVTSSEEGTPPASLVKAAKELGYQAEVKENLSLEDLQKSVDAGVPVIIAAQAWRDDVNKDKPWKDLWDDGHYMVVIGLDHKNVFFEDPSTFQSKGSIPRDEFLERWHDVDNNVPCNHLGIFVTGKEPHPFPQVAYIARR